MSPVVDSLDFALSQFIASKVWTKSTGTGAPGFADLFRAYVAAGVIPLNRLQDGKLIPDMFPADMSPLEWAIRRGAAEVAIELIHLGADTGLVPVRPPGAEGVDLIEFARSNVLADESRAAVVAGITEALMQRALVAAAPGAPAESAAQNRRARMSL